MKLSNKAYDILSKIQRWLPAIGIFYLALCQIWNFPYGDEVNKTILALAAFLAATLEISTGRYHAETATDLMYALVGGDESEQDEAEQDDEQSDKINGGDL